MTITPLTHFLDQLLILSSFFWFFLFCFLACTSILFETFQGWKLTPAIRPSWCDVPNLLTCFLLYMNWMRRFGCRLLDACNMSCTQTGLFVVACLNKQTLKCFSVSNPRDFLSIRFTGNIKVLAASSALYRGKSLKHTLKASRRHHGLTRMLIYPSWSLAYQITH